MATVNDTDRPLRPLTDEPMMGKKPMVERERVEMAAKPKKSGTFVYAVYGVVILLGVGTGYLLSKSIQGGGVAGSKKITVSNNDKTVGINDSATFSDQAEGVIEAGGVDGEGTHKLIREGGPSQTVAIVSSVLDLDEFVGQKVKVWGQSFPPQKAGWFMDIGKIEKLE